MPLVNRDPLAITPSGTWRVRGYVCECRSISQAPYSLYFGQDCAIFTGFSSTPQPNLAMVVVCTASSNWPTVPFHHARSRNERLPFVLLWSIGLLGPSCSCAVITQSMRVRRLPNRNFPTPTLSNRKYSGLPEHILARLPLFHSLIALGSVQALLLLRHPPTSSI